VPLTRAAARTLLVAALVLPAAAAGCSLGAGESNVRASGPTQTSAGATSSPTTTAGPTTVAAPIDVYAGTGAGMLSAQAQAAKPMVYVPNSQQDTVQEIDPATYRVVRTFRVSREPQHIVPSWDLKTLWVNMDSGNQLVPIDPRTGKQGKPVKVADPYNLYFTPDGKQALVMAEGLRRIDVRDPETMALRRSLPVPCYGVNHADFTADLKHFVASCEFSGLLLVLDEEATRVEKVIDLNAVKTPGATSAHDAMVSNGPKNGIRPGASAMPQDVRLSPDGRWLLVADMLRNGVWVIDAHTFAINRFVPTGKGAHGIYPSRDATKMYVSNRDAGTISVLDSTTLKQVALWTIPGGGSPDMGGVTADGNELWLSGRYNAVVYVFDTRTGKVTHRIKVNPGPHGLAVWPQPGSYSLGHTGNMR
jgi:YVTN family beta-propeller protein